MAFQRRSGSGPVSQADDPEQLYRLLARSNTGPDSVWGHQSKVLEKWHLENYSESDVAIELPTGAGKTLVGGLIGEFLRRKEDSRVAYLCPTKQLARQTANRLAEYGIPQVLLTGRVSTWNQANRAQFESGRAIAVSVYSHIFNSNPGLAGADLLVLDDAHAAEGYVAAPWSLGISRSDHESAYRDMLSVLLPALDPLVCQRLAAYTPDSQFLSNVYLASPLGVAAQSAELETALSGAVAMGKLDKGAIYAWRLIEGRVARCMVYISYHQILIRPLISPTFQHSAFSEPGRRLYMSATLGAGGELERSFGRRKIKRIPVPFGWDKEGTGRRFFAFPELAEDLASDNQKLAPFVAGVIAKAGRAVVLTPDSRTADLFRASFLPSGYLTLTAKEVEDDLTRFTSQAAAALVLNNRYDGIDLPDDQCRLVVLMGLPAKGDLQERFLHSSLGAVEVLLERMRARIQQGSGRATRNIRDHAAVLILGRDLTSYLTRRETQAAMHPEIHAELEFGVDTSLGFDSTSMLENLRVFAEHAEAWKAVDDDIVAARETYSREDAPGVADLQRAVRHEVVAAEAIWSGDQNFALDAIRTVLDKLRGDRTPKRYGSLWSYLGFGIAVQLANQTGDSSFRETADIYYRETWKNSQGTTWLSHLAAPIERDSAPEPSELALADEIAMRNILAATDLARIEAFEEIMKARVGLEGAEYTAYEAGLVHLGRLAGAEPSYGNAEDEGDALPDAVWIFGEAQWVLWEAKSQAKDTGQIGADQVRQAGAHLRTAEKEQGKAAPGDSVCLLVSPKTKVHASAHAVAEENVYWIRPAEVLDLFDRLARAWQKSRARGLATLSVPELASIFKAEQALPSQWLPILRSGPLWKKPES
ncbi:DEAD/DEAH box helicase [Umezawaea sp. Da 62-37]|uniref:DEAD/DEAH box helicase n=1 Tax=Umezawaea sp. Da 62-37 TaxID=3075927 RepID=UPI0028F74B8C|nr:DEAD/DEAH box helicase [Umezawaea sp. Da 62-37]WNV84712.1 DEAD/DEAH box helicase [Umezawaea sp. Da 62-37]